MPCLALTRSTVTQYLSAMARCDFRRRKLNFNATFLGSSSSERDGEATRAHSRTRPHDTFCHFAMLACAFWFLRHEGGNLEFKLYSSFICIVSDRWDSSTEQESPMGISTGCSHPPHP